MVLYERAGNSEYPHTFKKIEADPQTPLVIPLTPLTLESHQPWDTIQSLTVYSPDLIAITSNDPHSCDPEALTTTRYYKDAINQANIRRRPHPAEILIGKQDRIIFWSPDEIEIPKPRYKRIWERVRTRLGNK